MLILLLGKIWSGGGEGGRQGACTGEATDDTAVGIEVDPQRRRFGRRQFTLHLIQGRAAETELVRVLFRLSRDDSSASVIPHHALKSITHPRE